MTRAQIGSRFGRLVVIGTLPPEPPDYRRYVVVRCDCGQEKRSRADALTTGRTMSCGGPGCYRAGVSALKRTTHGLSRHPLYGLWAEMRRRCENPKAHNFHLYGGRGIKVCERWREFSAFLADIPPRPSIGHSLDRLDNNRGYELGNVAWKTAAEQSKNTRVVVRIIIDGHPHSLNSARCALGFSSDRPIRRLMERGYSPQQAVDELFSIRQAAA